MRISVLNCRTSAESVTINNLKRKLSKRIERRIRAQLELDHPEYIAQNRPLFHWKCRNSDYWDTIAHGLGTPIAEIDCDEENGETQQSFKIVIGGEEHQIDICRV